MGRCVWRRLTVCRPVAPPAILYSMAKKKGRKTKNQKQHAAQQAKAAANRKRAEAEAAAQQAIAEGDGKTLTDKQQRFVAEYLIDLNATQAAIRAGYSSATASQIGHELLQKTLVQDAIAAGQKTLAGNLQITTENVLREFARVAFSDIGQILDFSQVDPHLRPANAISEDARRAISTFKVRRHLDGHGESAREVEVTEFKLWDKLNALEKLARHLGLLKDQLEVTGKDGSPLLLQVVEETAEDDADTSSHAGADAAGTSEANASKASASPSEAEGVPPQ